MITDDLKKDSLIILLSCLLYTIDCTVLNIGNIKMFYKSINYERSEYNQFENIHFSSFENTDH